MEVFETSDAVTPAAIIARQVAVAAFEAATRVSGNSAARSAHVAGLRQSLNAAAHPDTPVEFGRPSPSERQQLATARSAAHCVTVLLTCPEAQELPQLLGSTGERLCAAVPVPSCCNNPLCDNTSCNTQLQQVQGRAAKCSGCGSARCDQLTELCSSAPVSCVLVAETGMQLMR